MASENSNTNNPSAAQRAQSTDSMRDNRQVSVSNDPSYSGQLQIGRIIMANPQLGTVYVRIPGRAEAIPCSMCAPASAGYAATGVGTTHVPPSGTQVLVFLPRDGNAPGIIIAVLPPMLIPTEGRNEQILINTMTDMEPGAGSTTEDAWQYAADDNEIPGARVAAQVKPVDQVPGEYSFASMFGGHVLISDLEQIWGASNGAQLQSFALEKLLRMIAVQFQAWLPLEDTHAYDDHGYVTEESEGSSNQCERRGQLFFGDPWLSPGQVDVKKLTDQELQFDGDPLPRRRRYHVKGFLAGADAAWVMQPDPNLEADTPDAQPMDRGTMGTQVDGSGRLVTATAGGVFLERTDTIPVPARRRDPQDPEGNKVEEDDPHEQKTPFKLDPANPAHTSLWLEDYLAWEKKLWYQRFVELNKDFWVPEERDMEPPEDEYDPEGQAAHDYTEYRGKRFVFWEAKDGTGGMRDDLGAEIVLAGGKVRINAPNGIEFCSGTDVIMLAGNDLLVKAHDSIDLVAHQKDIRIAAANHMQLQAQDGQLLLESLSEAAGQSGTGESQGGGGVSIRAPDSTVFLDGNRTQVSARSLLALETQVGTGTILLTSDRVSAVAKSVLLADEDGASLSLSRGSAIVAGAAVNLLGENSIALIENTQAWVPFWRAPLLFDVYGAFDASLDPVRATFRESTDWQGPYAPEDRDSIQFAYRNDADYMVEDLNFCDAYWPTMFRRESVEVGEWAEREYPETVKNRPWPGTDTPLFALEQENNVESGRLLTLRADRKDEGGKISEHSFLHLGRLDARKTSILPVTVTEDNP